MSNDAPIRDHKAWLGYVQQDGLVVSPTALVDARDKLGKAFENFLSEGSFPERRELISKFVAKLDPALHEKVQQKVFQDWLDRR